MKDHIEPYAFRPALCKRRMKDEAVALHENVLSTKGRVPTFTTSSPANMTHVLWVVHHPFSGSAARPE